MFDSEKDSVPMRDSKGYLTDEECEKILDVAHGKNRLLIFTLLKTGRRISEVVGKNGVCLSDLNERDSIIRWRIVKRGKRKIKLTDGVQIKYSYEKEKELKETNQEFEIIQAKPVEKNLVANPAVVAALSGYANSEHLDPETPIFNFSRQRAWKIIRVAGEKAGIKYVGEKRLHPHHFRHTFAMQKARGIKYISELTLLKDLMQHTNISNTAHYLTYSDEKMRELINR